MNDNQTCLDQDNSREIGIFALLSFGTGLLFAQFSFGLAFLIVYIIIIEIIVWCWRGFTFDLCRISYIVLSIFGFLIGRLAYDDYHPFRLWCRESCISKNFGYEDDF